jgi:hypothetical protein
MREHRRGVTNGKSGPNTPRTSRPIRPSFPALRSYFSTRFTLHPEYSSTRDGRRR